jgi:hypothetical protein
MASNQEPTRPQPDVEARRESGNPGGGAGRVDVPGRTGVYPVSGPAWPSGPAEFRGMASWGQGERGAAGYEDHGESELYLTPEGILLGGGPVEPIPEPPTPPSPAQPPGQADQSQAPP